MRFLKWFLLQVWTPANIRFGIVYSFFAQLKFLAEIVFIISGGYFLWFGVIPSKKLLGIIFAVLFVGGVGVGELLIRFQIPQKMNEKANKINPQMDLVNRIAEKLGVK